MFDLEHALRLWREPLLRAAGLRAEDLDELEDHLLSAFEARLDAGRDPADAFREASLALGSAHDLRTAFEQANPTMHPLSKLLGLAFSLGLVALAMVTGPGTLSFLNLPALVLLFGVVAGGLVAGFGPRLVARALRAAVAPVRALAPDEAAAFTAVFRRGYRLAWAGGVLGVLVGTIQLLSDLQDPRQLGTGLALCMLSLLYGAMLAELGFASMQQWLANRTQPLRLES